MTRSSEEDLDWLYGHGGRSAEPEPTRVLPMPPDGETGLTPIYRPDPPAAAQHAAQPTAQPTARPTARPTAQPTAQPTSYPPTGGVRPLPALPDPRHIQPAPPIPGSGGDGFGGTGRPPGTPPPGRPPKKRHPVRRTFGVLGILLALMLVWLIAVPVYAWSRVTRVDDEPSGDRPADQPGTTVLLVGSDSRAGLSAAERKRLGTGKTGGQRTDTMMILYVPPGGKPALISLPRDSYLPIPGKGSDKLNAAYALGGPELLVKTVEKNTGLRIDAYTEIGFGGFVSIIDALGGIEMCLPSAIKDKDSHIDLPKGCQTLSGTNALGYVRMRKADPLGDLGRVQRQREMLAAVAKEAASPLTLINPVRYWSLATAGADSLSIGTDTSFFEVVTFARGLMTVSSGGGLTLTVPIANPGASTPAGSAVLWDEAKAKAMFADIARGDTSDLAQYAR